MTINYIRLPIFALQDTRVMFTLHERPWTMINLGEVSPRYKISSGYAS